MVVAIERSDDCVDRGRETKCGKRCNDQSGKRINLQVETFVMNAQSFETLCKFGSDRNHGLAPSKALTVLVSTAKAASTPGCSSHVRFTMLAAALAHIALAVRKMRAKVG